MLTLKHSSAEQSSITFDRNVTDVLKFIACLMVALGHYYGYCSVNDIHNVFIDAITHSKPAIWLSWCRSILFAQWIWAYDE